jgi:hypothetical protein
MVREIRPKNAPDVRIVLNQEDAADPVIWRAKMTLSAAHSGGDRHVANTPKEPFIEKWRSHLCAGEGVARAISQRAD